MFRGSALRRRVDAGLRGGVVEGRRGERGEGGIFLTRGRSLDGAACNMTLCLYYGARISGRSPWGGQV